MVNAMLSLGLEPSAIHSVDVPYSAAEAVASRLERVGVPSANILRHAFTLEQNYQCVPLPPCVCIYI